MAEIGLFKTKTLLIVSNGYVSKDGIPNQTFVKSQVDVLKDYFEKIVVISPMPYFPRILSKIKFIPHFFKSRSFFEDYSYDNVDVYFPKFLTLPIKIYRDKNHQVSYRCAYRLINKKKIKFDLIHAHFSWPAGYIGMKLKEKFNKKLVLTIHENRDWFLKEYYSNNEILKEVWKKSDTIIRVNKQDIPLLKKFNENSIYIPNGFESKLFKKLDRDVRSELNIPKDKKVLLNVAQYKIVHKNQINLISAINELVKIRQDIVLYLIGEGDDRKKIQNKIRELNLQDYVKVTGSKSHDQIPLWMNVGDLFVLPSYSEGNPTVMFEALGCGLPYIGTNVGGVGEIINSDISGSIYSNPDNFFKLAELIANGLNEEWDYDKILNYSKSFTWENVVNKIILEYKKLLI